MSALGIILVALLFAGIFYLVAYKPKAKPNLKVGRSKTENAKAIVIFVSETKEGKSIDDVLAFQVLNQLVNSENENAKYAWLLHTQFGDENSSNANAERLVKEFNQRNSLKIFTKPINDIFNTEEVFQVASSMLLDETLPVKIGDILCDCTAGPKTLTLGLALALLGKARLVYYPLELSNPGKEYIQLDAGSFLQMQS